MAILSTSRLTTTTHDRQASSAKMVSPVVLATTAMIVVFLLAQRYLSLPVLPNEPLLIPHWMPFFGHAFRFARSKRSFFRWAK